MPHAAHLALLALILSCALPAWGHELNLAPLRRDVAALQRDLDQLSHAGTLGAGLVSTADAHRSYETALADHLLGNHLRAAETFFALRYVMADPALVADADWYLAQSLAAEGMDDLGNEVLEEVISSPSHPYRQDAARQQLDYLAGLGDPHRFANRYVDLEQMGIDVAGPTMAYTLGRSWLRLGHLAAAREHLNAVPSTAETFPRAQYLLATVAVREGLLDEAAQGLELVSIVAKDRHLQDLTKLALARLAYEAGNLEQATAVYTSIGGDSAVLDEALYELAWTYVRAQRPDLAIQTIDLYLLAFGEKAPAGRLQVVRGHLSMQAGDWAEAESTYGSLEGDLLPVAERLATLSPAELASSLQGRGRALPRWVVQAAAADPAVARSLRTQTDAHAVVEAIAQAEHLATEVEDLAASDVVVYRHRRVRRSAFEALARSGRGLLVAADLELSGRRGRAQRQRTRPLREHHEVLQARLAEVVAQAQFEAGLAEAEEELLSTLDQIQGLVADVKTSRDDAHHDASVEKLDELLSHLTAARQQAHRLLDSLQDAQLDVVAPLRALVARHRDDLIRARREQLDTSTRSSRAWRHAAETRVRQLFDFVDQSIEESLAGVGDASWAQMTDATTRREESVRERSERVAKLEELFSVVKARY